MKNYVYSGMSMYSKLLYIIINNIKINHIGIQFRLLIQQSPYKL